MKTCLYCKEDFMPDKSSRQYCSNKCRELGKGNIIRNAISNRTWIKIISRAYPNWHCPMCEKEDIKWGDSYWSKAFEVHHILPRKDGGLDDAENLILLCPNHHSLANKGLIDIASLNLFSVGQLYPNKELLERFYFGNNSNRFSRKKKSDQRDLELHLLDVDVDLLKVSRKEKEKRKCLHCSKEYAISNNSQKYCSSKCSNENRRVATRPSKEELVILLDNNTWTAIGQMYKVSDNAIRKWARSYGL